MFWELAAGFSKAVEVGVIDPDEGNSKLDIDENLMGLGGGIFWTLLMGIWAVSAGGCGGVNLGHSGMSSGELEEIWGGFGGAIDGGFNIDRSTSSDIPCEGGLGGGIGGGSRVDRSTGEYGSSKNADGGVTCPGGGGINWGGGGGGAIDGGGGIRICSSSVSSTEMALPFDRLTVLPVHEGKYWNGKKNV